jgi:regulator of RNase E activity RraA
MTKTIEPNASVDRELLGKLVAMKGVLSISCVMTDAQARENVMHPDIKFRSVNKPFIGHALTVKLTPGDIVDCLDIFAIAEPGQVVVIDAFGESNTSIWGGLMSGLARAAGIVGAVVDGSVRDTDEAKVLDFPIASRHVSPRAAHTAYSGRREPIRINVPVVCGGLIVHPGDLVVADEIGVTVVPQQDWAEVYPRAREQADKEEATRKAILEGATVEELLSRFGRL